MTRCRNPTCRLEFYPCDWVPWRAAGYCSAACANKIREKTGEQKFTDKGIAYGKPVPGPETFELE